MVAFGKPLMWDEPPATGGSREQSAFRLPAGTVTFLLSDIEGSTRLWEDAPQAMPTVVADTYAILDEAVARYAGVRPLEQGEGDSVVAAFSRASDALAAALDAQRTLHAHHWPDEIDLRLRIALHTADAQLRDEGNYFGVALSRCARLRGIAHGGQTLISHATHDLVVDRLPDSARLVDCGSHRLRDLGRPEHVYALAHPELPSDFGPLRSLDEVPNNLPDQQTSFIGRARELDELRAALEDTRVLTLTGAGGAGKTRLALHTAADVLERFPDGAWWAGLAALAEPALVAETLAAAIGVRPLPGMTALQASCAYLAERRALIVLDNCEHLLPACSEVAEALLHGCPGVTVIASSRTPLGIAGETDWRVPSLSLPAGELAPEPIAVLGQSDAVRLFIERARKARPNFAVTNENAPSVAQICVDLDGLPLAIELAAARVRMLSVEQIAAGLSDRFHLLTGGVRTALPRHQTLHASVDWSHDLLSDAERTLFRRLSVFAGGFTLDACEHVGTGDGLARVEVLDLLASLVDKSLVAAEEHGPAVRYRLLETVRQYALERSIEAGEHDEVRARHRDALLALAEAAMPGLEVGGQRHSLELLDAEAGNFAAALDCAVETDGELALRFCKALTYWWRLRGSLAAAERGFSRALDAAPEAPPALRALVLAQRSYLAFIAGKYEQALVDAEAGSELAEEADDPGVLARALTMVGALRLHPDPVGSRDVLRRAAELAATAGDDWCWAFDIVDLALSHMFCDEYAEAQRCYDEVAPVVERLRFHEVEGWLCIHRSYERLVRADITRAREWGERAVAAAREVGDHVVEAIALSQIAAGDLHSHGRPHAALARLEASRECVVAAGAGLALPYVDMTLASARASLGDHRGAVAGLESLIATGVDFGRMLANAKVQLADVLRVSGDWASAEAQAHEALEIGERIGIPFIVGWGKEILGRAAAERGEWKAADALLHEALAHRLERELWLYVPPTLDALADVAAGLESDEEAARIMGAAARARTDFGLVRWAPDEQRLAELERKLRERLGEAGFETAHADGAGLTFEEAIAWVRRARGERKRPSRGWASLTPTEVEVVQLLAEGLTNPQIGARMFVTRGTVKVHLSHIFAKLGVATRAELAAEAVRRGIPAATPRNHQ